MPSSPLRELRSGSNVFIDANIFIYAINGSSPQCRHFLERCSREEVTGISLFEIVNETTHRFMMAEALSKRLIQRESAGELRKRFNVISTLTDYWRNTERILDLNILLLPTEDTMVRSANTERRSYCLLTNDSMIAACMRGYGVSCIATNDGDFDRVHGFDVFRPDDLP
jgi:predicted nucleic acid-binding protein